MAELRRDDHERLVLMTPSCRSAAAPSRAGASSPASSCRRAGRCGAPRGSSRQRGLGATYAPEHVAAAGADARM
eukprot:6513066-Pyramimonas_sp.AAC.1